MTRERTSRGLAYVLRHSPGVVDASGWTLVDEALAALRALGHTTDAPTLRAIALADPVRYELDGNRIRARHGHSVPVALDHPIAVPPDVLFHGTVARFVASIRDEGLMPGERNAVHLSATREGAMRVGGRRGAPICIEVRARAAHDAGVAFTKVGDGAVWLVPALAPDYLVIPDRAVPRRRRSSRAPE